MKYAIKKKKKSLTIKMKKPEPPNLNNETSTHII